MTLADHAERMIARLSEAYDKENTSNNYKLLTIPAEQQDDVLTTLQDILRSHWVGYATGIQLDRIGTILGVPRESYWTGSAWVWETDTQYRDRLQESITNLSAGGTIDSIRKHLFFILQLLGWVGTLNDITVVDLEDPPGSGYWAHIIIGVGGDHTGMYENIFTTPYSGRFWDEANKVKAAAIKIETIGGAIVEQWGAEFIETLYYQLGNFYIPEERWGAEFVEDADRYHRTQITYTESLNITKP